MVGERCPRGETLAPRQRLPVDAPALMVSASINVSMSKENECECECEYEYEYENQCQSMGARE